MGAAHNRARRIGRQAAQCERATARFADSADPGLPPVQGLYDPALEKDSCGVGFIADIKGRSSHKLIEDALAILCNLEHRGAVGADPRAGDGAGILVQIPHKFFAKQAERLGFALPTPREYAVGALFMPRDPDWRQVIRDIYAQMIRREGMTLLGWREVPTDNSTLGESVKPTEPVHLQVFIGRGKKIKTEDEFERRLYILRKSISNAIYTRKERRLSGYYPVSISCRTIVYKGMFLADQLGTYYPDLRDEDFDSALALVHQRFSTNTFPAWSLAHPYRMIAHNGEINTLRGNVNWMAARQASVSSDLFGDDINKLWPISYEGQSDTACFDNALEFLVQGGYPLAHAMMMMIPEAWAGNPLMDEERRAFYEYNAADGAVGRPGGDRLHQRPPDRRHPRPQRLAPGALFRHPRRPHHHGLGDGRPAHCGEGHRDEVAPAAGQDAAGRSRPGPPHSRRGAQGDAGQEPPLQGVARTHADRARGSA
jgi:glutamate synthase (NADPH) large chain